MSCDVTASDKGMGEDEGKSSRPALLLRPLLLLLDAAPASLLPWRKRVTVRDSIRPLLVRLNRLSSLRFLILLYRELLSECV